jgi:hypothetical protein
MENRTFAYNDRFPVSWPDTLQEFISTFASSNFQITLASPTTIQVVASAGNGLVGIGVEGKWRYNIATANAAHPGGGAGTYDVYAVASANSFAASGLPPGSNPEVDNTDYTFGLVIVAGGAAAPTGTFNGHAIAHTRKVATLAWSGSAITTITHLVGPYAASDSTVILDGSLTPAKIAGVAVVTGDSRLSDARVPVAHAASHAPGGSDPVAQNSYGTYALRPAAVTALNGSTYYAIDQDAMYLCVAAAWIRLGDKAGDIIWTAEVAARTGYIICAGQAWPGTTGIYADLWAKWGAQYPSVLPDMPGRTFAAKGTHADVDTIGKTDGLVTGSRRTKHKHTVVQPTIAMGPNSGRAFDRTGPGTEDSGGAAIGQQIFLTATASGGTVGPQTGAEPIDTAAYIVLQPQVKL